MHSTKTLLPVKSTHMHRVAQKIPHHFTSKKRFSVTIANAVSSTFVKMNFCRLLKLLIYDCLKTRNQKTNDPGLFCATLFIRPAAAKRHDFSPHYRKAVMHTDRVRTDVLRDIDIQGGIRSSHRTSSLTTVVFFPEETSRQNPRKRGFCD